MILPPRACTTLRYSLAVRVLAPSFEADLSLRGQLVTWGQKRPAELLECVGGLEKLQDVANQHT